MLKTERWTPHQGREASPWYKSKCLSFISCYLPPYYKAVDYLLLSQHTTLMPHILQSLTWNVLSNLSLPRNPRFPPIPNQGLTPTSEAFLDSLPYT